MLKRICDNSGRMNESEKKGERKKNKNNFFGSIEYSLVCIPVKLFFRLFLFLLCENGNNQECGKR